MLKSYQYIIGNKLASWVLHILVCGKLCMSRIKRHQSEGMVVKEYVKTAKEKRHMLNTQIRGMGRENHHSSCNWTRQPDYQFNLWKREELTDRHIQLRFYHHQLRIDNSEFRWSRKKRVISWNSYVTKR